MKLSIIGTGYVGLVTGVCLSLKGNKVICVDNIQNKVDKINSGNPVIYEKNLKTILKDVLRKKSFQCTTNLKSSIINSDITIIAVGTPDKNGKVDKSFIAKAVEQTGRAIKAKNKYHVIAIKSTVPPTTTDSFVRNILINRCKLNQDCFGLVMSPEFLREGNAVEDCLNPSRIIVGQQNAKCGKIFAKLYKKTKAPIFFTNLRTAELIKYASNALLATLISFSNEIAKISERIGNINEAEVMRGVHLDLRFMPIDPRFSSTYKRIKPGLVSYLWPGPGYGGSCFPKDVNGLIDTAKQYKINTHIINAVATVNQKQPDKALNRIKTEFGSIQNSKIAVLGLAFKPGTDDMRESPSIPIVEGLLKGSATVYAHDPIAEDNAKCIIKSKKLKFVKYWQEAVENADLIILMTTWDKYINELTENKLLKLANKTVIFDTRCALDAKKFKKIKIFTIGKRNLS